MKLYYHPASTASRPVLLFAAESGLDLDLKLVDIFKGEHLQPAYRALNANALVPMLEDGDFRLTESSAILKYLADKIDSPLYPKDLKQRARVNERMDLVQHPTEPRLLLRPGLRPAAAAPQAAQRRGAGRHGAVGPGALEGMAASPQRPHPRPRAQLRVRRCDHHRGLFRRLTAHLGRGDRLRIRRPSLRAGLAGAHQGAEELEVGERHARRDHRRAQGRVVRDRVKRRGAGVQKPKSSFGTARACSHSRRKS